MSVSGVMDQMTLTPDRTRYAHRQYAQRQPSASPHGRAADAFDTVAWKAPQSPRFHAASANDGHEMPSVMDELRALPRWLVISTGGAFSALMGVMLGAAFRL